MLQWNKTVKLAIETDIQQSQEGPIDVNVNDIMCINDSQNAMIIDEKNIAVGAELDVETVKNDTDKEGKFGLNIQVHSTPVSLVDDRSSVMEDNIDPKVVAK